MGSSEMSRRDAVAVLKAVCFDLKGVLLDHSTAKYSDADEACR